MAIDGDLFFISALVLLVMSLDGVNIWIKEHFNYTQFSFWFLVTGCSKHEIQINNYRMKFYFGIR